MRILLSLSECPYPADTGPRNHSLGLLKIAAGLGDCDVVGFSNDAREATRWRRLEELLPSIRIRELLPRAAGIRAAWGGMQCLADRFPISARPYFLAGTADRLRRIVAAGRYDLVHVDSFRLCRLTSQLLDVPTVLVPPDAFSMSFRRALPNCRTPAVYLRCLARYTMFSHIERKYFPLHDVVCPVSNLDGDWLRLRVPAANVREVAIPVAERFFRESYRPQDASRDPHIVLAGSFIEDCVTRDTIDFLEHCLPLLRRAVPKLRLTVWGRVRSAALKRCLEQTSSVDVVSWVEDYQAMLRSAWVYVYPQSAMSGIQTKVQQAMACGVPVVGRSASMRPLFVDSGTHAYIADDRQEMVDAILCLLQDESLRRDVGLSGRDLMRQRFDSSAVAYQLQASYLAAAKQLPASNEEPTLATPAYVH